MSDDVPLQAKLPSTESGHGSLAISDAGMAGERQPRLVLPAVFEPMAHQCQVRAVGSFQPALRFVLKSST